MDQIFWQELIEILQVIAPVAIAVPALFYMWKQTGDLAASFDKFTDKIVNNPTITERLEQKYDKLTDKQRIPVDFALDVIGWWDRLTPDEKGDVWAKWADNVRDGIPETEKQSVAVPRHHVPFKPMPQKTPLGDAFPDEDGEG